MRTCVYADVYVQLYACVCVFMYLYVYLYAYIQHVYLCVNMHLCVCGLCTRVCLCYCVFAFMCLYVVLRVAQSFFLLGKNSTTDPHSAPGISDSQGCYHSVVPALQIPTDSVRPSDSQVHLAHSSACPQR